ncbi:hypothetical protein HX817_14225 [Pseudomonas sp. C6002]|uniref:hypothetical protein n=1 Tax=Pseudomonas sp. C6002 TaxID=2738814 RepID=UPI0015A319E2|nr:hypothetical protein [Pseudomonas sp. C6002]NWA32703.1 hypothetical protein [Pseudomonas sp. C6002]
MKIVSFFRASVLALAIAGASGTGYGSLMTGVSTYQKSVEWSQSVLTKAPMATSASDHQDDQAITRHEYIFAWVLGKDCWINKIGPCRSDPFRSLQGKLSDWARVVGDHADEVVVSLIIKVPDNPWELQETIAALGKHTLFYAPDAHTGFIEPAFIVRGNNMS